MSEDRLEGATSSIRIADYLRDAVVELEVWRQNARSVSERQALQRVSTLLSLASVELRANGNSKDPTQQMLHLVDETG